MSLSSRATNLLQSDDGLQPLRAIMRNPEPRALGVAPAIGLLMLWGGTLEAADDDADAHDVDAPASVDSLFRQRPLLWDDHASPTISKSIDVRFSTTTATAAAAAPKDRDAHARSSSSIPIPITPPPSSSAIRTEASRTATTHMFRRGAAPPDEQSSMETFGILVAAGVVIGLFALLMMELTNPRSSSPHRSAFADETALNATSAPLLITVEEPPPPITITPPPPPLPYDPAIATSTTVISSSTSSTAVNERRAARLVRRSAKPPRIGSTPIVPPNPFRQ